MRNRAFDRFKFALKMAALTGAPLPAAFGAPSAALGANTYVHTKDVPLVKLVTNIQQLFASVGRASWLIQPPGISPEVPEPVQALFAPGPTLALIAANRAQHAAVPINQPGQRDVLDAALLTLTKLLAANSAALKAIRDSRTQSIDDVKAAKALDAQMLSMLGYSAERFTGNRIIGPDAGQVLPADVLASVVAAADAELSGLRDFGKFTTSVENFKTTHQQVSFHKGTPDNFEKALADIVKLVQHHELIQPAGGVPLLSVLQAKALLVDILSSGTDGSTAVGDALDAIPCDNDLPAWGILALADLAKRAARPGVLARPPTTASLAARADTYTPARVDTHTRGQRGGGGRGTPGLQRDPAEIARYVVEFQRGALGLNVCPIHPAVNNHGLDKCEYMHRTYLNRPGNNAAFNATLAAGKIALDAERAASRAARTGTA